MPSRTPFLRVISRAFLAASRARAASTILPQMILASAGFLEQVIGERLADDVLDRAAHFARDELVLGLARELRLGHLDREDARQALAHVVAGDFDLGFLGELVVLDVLVDDARHRRAQSGQVGAAVALRNVVGEAEDVLAVAVVPLHRDFARDRRVLVAVLPSHRVEDVGMEHLLAVLMNSRIP
jgi:hypothetical protein